MGYRPGLLGGVLAVTFPPAGLVPGGGALLAGAAAGAGFGGAVTALMKSHEHNPSLDDFLPEIEQRELLLMVDVPRDLVEPVKERVLKHHLALIIVSASRLPGVQKRSAKRVAFAVIPKASLRCAFGLQVLLAGTMTKAHHLEAHIKVSAPR